jgi:hypothetical protein
MWVGQFVDAKVGPRSPKWHGVIVRIEASEVEQLIWVTWLMSEQDAPANRINPDYSVVYSRGYTTIEREEGLEECSDGMTGPFSPEHPATNPWGLLHGMV